MCVQVVREIVYMNLVSELFFILRQRAMDGIKGWLRALGSIGKDVGSEEGGSFMCFSLFSGGWAWASYRTSRVYRDHGKEEALTSGDGIGDTICLRGEADFS